CKDVRNLTYGHRKRALDWYREVPETELPKLSSASLLALARLLRMAGLSSRALHVYEVLVKTHTATPGAALEAGRIAHRESKADKARWFLQHALAAPLPEAERAEAQALLQS